MTHGEILDFGKFLSDLFALVTTLDTGMIGLIIAILEKVFTPQRVFTSQWNKGLFAASLFLPIASLFSSIMALISIRSNVAALLQGGTSSQLVDPFFFYASFGFFFFGVCSFVVLATNVVYSTPPTEMHKKRRDKETQAATQLGEDRS